jgi:hypothetical protein
MEHNVFLPYLMWGVTKRLIVILNVCVKRQELDGMLAIIVQMVPVAKAVSVVLWKVIVCNNAVNIIHKLTKI